MININIADICSANVLPSAPPNYGDEATCEATTQTSQQLYPVLPAQPENVRMNKINEIAATLNQEVEHYRLVAKKYQKAKTVVHCFAVGTGGLSGFLSSAGVALALSGIGIIASVLFGLSSAAMTVTTKKKIETNVKKNFKKI